MYRHFSEYLTSFVLFYSYHKITKNVSMTEKGLEVLWISVTCSSSQSQFETQNLTSSYFAPLVLNHYSLRYFILSNYNVCSCPLGRMFHFKPKCIFRWPLLCTTLGSPSQTVQRTVPLWSWKMPGPWGKKPCISMRLFSPLNNEIFMNAKIEWWDEMK